MSDSVQSTLKELFEAVDTDHSGALDYNEVVTMLNELGIKQSEVNTTLLWYVADKDENGVLTYDEFYALMTDLPSIVQIPDFLSELVFDKIDTDNSGSIGVSEVKNMLRSLGINVSWDQAEQILNSFDEDQNGTLELDEFRRFMRIITHQE